MNLATTAPVPAAYQAAYLMSAELVNSTSATARASVVDEELVDRSFVGSPIWGPALLGGEAVRGQTAVSELAPYFVGPERVEDALIAQLLDFGDLEDGWDGESAKKPRIKAVRDAVRFIRAAGDLAASLEATLHVDGSIILEIGDGEAGSFRFTGDGMAIYATASAGRGVAAFDEFAVPDEIRRALGA